MTDVVDVHSHVVPDIIAPDRGRGSMWPSVGNHDGDRASVIVDGKVFREIDSRCWSTERRLADMTTEAVKMQVLSPMPELLSYWLSPEDTEYLADTVNAFIAGMVATQPTRFIGLGMVPAQDPARAVRTLHRIKALGLAGVEIGTHVNTIPLGDRALWPIYENAEALGLAVFVHPLKPCGLDRMGGVPEVGLVASFPLEIAMAATSFLAGGVLQAFPGLRILLSHGGGALASLLGRVEAVRTMLPSMQAILGDDSWSLARRFWFDTNVYDAETLQFLARKMGVDRLVVGSDYPFLIRQDHPGRFVEQALPGILPQCCANAADFLFGERTGPGAALLTD